MLGCGGTRVGGDGGWVDIKTSKDRIEGYGRKVRVRVRVSGGIWGILS